MSSTYHCYHCLLLASSLLLSLLSLSLSLLLFSKRFVIISIYIILMNNFFNNLITMKIVNAKNHVADNHMNMTVIVAVAYNKSTITAATPPTISATVSPSPSASAILHYIAAAELVQTSTNFMIDNQNNPNNVDNSYDDIVDNDNCTATTTAAVATTKVNINGARISASMATVTINENVNNFPNEKQIVMVLQRYKNIEKQQQQQQQYRQQQQQTLHDNLLKTIDNELTQNNSNTVEMSSSSATSTCSNTTTCALHSKYHRHQQQHQQKQQQQQQQHLLHRPKRYLAFPDGASFSVAVCFTVGIIGNPRYNYMSFGLNWGVAYDLPNDTWALEHVQRLAERYPVPPTVLRRRTRRALYKEIETIVENMGYNGRDCVLRALCESRQYFQKTKMSMIGEMVRAIFSLPKQRIFTRELHENADIALYDRAYRKSRSVDCGEQYDCSFSLLELAFGKYSTPPPGYYGEH